MYFQQIFCGCGEKDWGKTEYCLMKPRLKARLIFIEDTERCVLCTGTVRRAVRNGPDPAGSSSAAGTP